VAQAIGSDFNANYTYDNAGHITYKKEGTNEKTGYRYFTGNSRLKNTSGSTSDADYIYDKHGNLVVDKNKKMVIEYDWRDMPIAFRFYSSIPTSIGVSASGQYEFASSELLKDLYQHMVKKASTPTSGVTLLSQVTMCYDASGNRVLKMESK
jgi:hypothetical protein